jgi:hypothetical protein
MQLTDVRALFQDSFKGFRESVRGPLSADQILSIMSRFEAPLHPRWLHFLSSAQEGLDAVGSAVSGSSHADCV